ncbi:hypothetical protein QBC40DRAFT_300733 [Triangularia verruculosa]|uniref:Uncharacterized protein n=1 Tax=Triangularia verruculosa TaxID=2587418 RepID=A0AAN6XAM5_9PEZI|nr:hypothetical protein QBC40DRAFT_300733 [Triangularia verruculosa]
MSPTCPHRRPGEKSTRPCTECRIQATLDGAYYQQVGYDPTRPTAAQEEYVKRRRREEAERQRQEEEKYRNEADLQKLQEAELERRRAEIALLRGGKREPRAYKGPQAEERVGGGGGMRFAGPLVKYGAELEARDPTFMRARDAQMEMEHEGYRMVKGFRSNVAEEETSEEEEKKEEKRGRRRARD